MKKLIDVLSPFVLLLVPVIAAVILGIGYQLHQQQEAIASHTQAAEQAVPLFYQGVHLIKAVCAVAQQNVW